MNTRFFRLIFTLMGIIISLFMIVFNASIRILFVISLFLLIAFLIVEFSNRLEYLTRNIIRMVMNIFWFVILIAVILLISRFLDIYKFSNYALIDLFMPSQTAVILLRALASYVFIIKNYDNNVRIIDWGKHNSISRRFSYKFKRRMAFLITLFTSYLVSILVLFFNLNKDVGIMIVLIVSILQLFFGSIFQDRHSIVKTKFIGIDCLDFFKYPMVVTTMTRRSVSEYTRVFMIDLTSILPDNSIIKEYYLTEHNMICETTDSSVFEKGILWIAFNITDSNRKYVFDSIKIKYSYNGKEYIGNFVITISLSKVGNEYLITNAVVNDYSYGEVKSFTYFRPWKIHDQTKGKYINALFQFYYYNQNIDIPKIDLKNSLIESRKFILHEGGFGQGKTAYDTLSISDAGYKPVLISFWQENYNHEMLFVLYNRLRKQCKKKFTRPTRVTLFTFVVIVTIFIGSAVTILKNIYLFPNFSQWIEDINKLLQNSNEESLMIFSDIFITSEALVIVFAIIGFFISLLIAPEFIIYKNNSSEYYQDFFLEYIKKSILRENIVLVIEDLDRLDAESIDRAFRLIANLNFKFRDEARYIGIVSFEENKIIEIMTEKYGAAANKRVFEQLEKIVVPNRIKREENLDVFIKNYLTKLFNYYLQCKLENQSEQTTRIISKNVKKYINLVKDSDYNNQSLRKVREIIPIMSKYLIEINECDDKKTLPDPILAYLESL